MTLLRGMRVTLVRSQTGQVYWSWKGLMDVGGFNIRLRLCMRMMAYHGQNFDEGFDR